jgi:hypothetical protein
VLLRGEAVVLEFFSAPFLHIRAQGELLHVLTGATPFDPGRESSVLSLEVDGWHGDLAGQRATTARVPLWCASSSTLLLLWSGHKTGQGL